MSAIYNLSPFKSIPLGIPPKLIFSNFSSFKSTILTLPSSKLETYILSSIVKKSTGPYPTLYLYPILSFSISYLVILPGTCIPKQLSQTTIPFESSVILHFVGNSPTEMSFIFISLLQSTILILLDCMFTIAAMPHLFISIL
ncbi:hypothetical protein D3C81_981000 [compost metagenome]